MREIRTSGLMSGEGKRDASHGASNRALPRLYYVRHRARDTVMDNRISEIRKVIRALRVSMREAEAIMHEQIKRDENCGFVAREVMKMRIVMSELVRERTRLGDTDPIIVSACVIPRRRPAGRRAGSGFPTRSELVRRSATCPP